VLLVARAILDIVMSLNRGFHPTGPVLVLVEIAYTVTDPPLRLLRRFIPPLRIGSIALDLGFLLLFVVVQFAISYASGI
jgi:YggT family protein